MAVYILPSISVSFRASAQKTGDHAQNYVQRSEDFQNDNLTPLHEVSDSRLFPGFFPLSDKFGIVCE